MLVCILIALSLMQRGVHAGVHPNCTQSDAEGGGCMLMCILIALSLMRRGRGVHAGVHPNCTQSDAEGSACGCAS